MERHFLQLLQSRIVLFYGTHDEAAKVISRIFILHFETCMRPFQ